MGCNTCTQSCGLPSTYSVANALGGGSEFAFYNLVYLLEAIGILF